MKYRIKRGEKGSGKGEKLGGVEGRVEGENKLRGALKRKREIEKGTKGKGRG